MSRVGSIDVGLVTYRELPLLSEGDRLLRDALAARGLSVEPLVWDDPSVGWESARLLVVRSVWDYHLRRPEFLEWVDAASEKTALWNPARVIRWNSHKGYLRELEGRGVATVPTVWVQAGGQADLAEIMAREGWSDVVVKPVISLSAYGTLRVGSDNISEGQAHLRQLGAEREMMVQPYIASVEGYGERSLVYLGDRFSHSVRRRPVLVEAQGREEFSTLVEPTPEELALAEAALSAVGEPLLYARVDVVWDGEPGARGTVRLMELELVEPSLFLPEAEGSADRFANAIEDLLG